MLLSASSQDEINAAYAEKILIDLSAAFDHTFSMRQDKIGEKSKATRTRTGCRICMTR